MERPSSGTYPREAHGSYDKNTKLSELEGVKHDLCMMQPSIDHARQGSVKPKNKYNVIVWVMEDIKTVLVQLINKIKITKTSATK